MLGEMKYGKEREGRGGREKVSFLSSLSFYTEGESYMVNNIG